MPTPPLNRLQRLVTKHYAGGRNIHHECHIPGDTGDTLFDFIMAEANDDCLAEAEDHCADPVVVLLQRLVRASSDLVKLQGALLKEIDQ